MTRLRPVLLACAIAVIFGLPEPSAASEPVFLTVRSGRFVRKDTPIRVELPIDRLGLAAAKALEDGPKRVTLREWRYGATIGDPIAGQLDRLPREMARVTFLLPGETADHVVRRFALDPDTVSAAKGEWTLTDASAGAVELKRGDRLVFRYNLAPVSNPNFPPGMARDAYIHPAYTPSGELITGDFSKAHPHHRGIFFAYTKTQVGDLHPDFWNFQSGTGKIHFDRLESLAAGPVTARIVSRHRWEAKGAGTVLNETWEIEAFDVPGSPFWLFDLTSTQQPAKAPIELPPYRYGGMAYRGPDPFLKGPLDVLTSEGLDRQRGDQKPARWVDLTGPVKEGSERYGGAAILDHPSNKNHPTVARIHPTSLPFFAFTPSHDAKVTIPADRPTVFRYRVVIHDGHPHAALDERLWRDFAEPPTVVIEGRGP
jgi:hypothetical protein